MIAAAVLPRVVASPLASGRLMGVVATTLGSMDGLRSLALLGSTAAALDAATSASAAWAPSPLAGPIDDGGVSLACVPGAGPSEGGFCAFAAVSCDEAGVAWPSWGRGAGFWPASAAEVAAGADAWSLASSSRDANGLD